MNCLWCDQEIIIRLNWRNLFRLTEQIHLCETCDQSFEIIQGSRCQKCSRPANVTVCPDCSYWDNGNDPLIFNYSIYMYNEMMRDIIAKWKYRGDYNLSEIFQTNFRKAFEEKFSSLMENAIVVPIPLSEERLNERGFNQAEVLADFLPIQRRNIIKRMHSEKQSKKSRVERLSAKNPFILTEAVPEKVILIDDIYTTGTTLRHAASLLERSGCSEIYAHTLVRG